MLKKDLSLLLRTYPKNWIRFATKVHFTPDSLTIYPSDRERERERERVRNFSISSSCFNYVTRQKSLPLLVSRRGSVAMACF